VELVHNVADEVLILELKVKQMSEINEHSDLLLDLHLFSLHHIKLDWSFLLYSFNISMIVRVLFVEFEAKKC
jgi:hypothetical protein